MPRIVLFTPTKNEADRYLQSFLQWVRPMVDFIFVWDDRSDDAVSRINHQEYDLYDWGVDRIMLRLEDEVPFLENEGKFRETGWNCMIKAADVQDGDWILTLDADEYWTGTRPREVVELAEQSKMTSVRVGIREIFKAHPPEERIDGWWGSIYDTRLIRFQPGDQSFPRRGMGSGTVPNYGNQGKRWPDLYEHGAAILHYGYAHKDDRIAKFERYSQLSGHSSEHIRSIQRNPDLSPWIGEQPKVWRGVK